MILIARILDITAGTISVFTAAKKAGVESGIDFYKLFEFVNKQK